MQSVKQERHDEAELQELAQKMVEANRAKMTAAAARPQMPQCQNVNILNFLGNPAKKNAGSTSSTVGASTSDPDGDVDEESVRGRFGWTTLGKVHIPYIFRVGDKYCAVRMVEMKLLNKYLNFLHQDIYNCTCIRSYYITDAEGRLLNEINIKHCDYQFGRDQFTNRDLIVKLSDAEEFYNFLDACYNKLLSGSQNVADRCGFIRINQESVVPYTVYNNQKYVPLFYFEGETDNLKLKANKLEGWDLSYLKFCCKVQGIRNELFAHDSCSVISLNDIKNYFPPGTHFDDYWPKKTLDSQLLINGKAQTAMIQWIKEPLPPPMLPIDQVSPKPAAQAKPPTNPQQHQQPQQQQQQPMHHVIYPNYGNGQYQPPTPAHPRPASTPAGRPSYIPPTSVSRAMRPGSYYSHSSGMQQAPPLVRSAQPAASYTSAQTAGAPANYMMLGEQPMVQPGSYRPQHMAAPPPPPQQQQQPPKYPPPLIPVRHLNGGLRYDGQQYNQGMDVVDLPSVQGHSQQPIINQQPAHQQSSRGQVAVTVAAQHPDDHGNISNGNMSMNSLQRKLTPLPDPPTSGNHIPYKLQKALVQGKMIPCINMKPYVYTELLVTLPDLVSNFFNNMPVQSCHQVMSVLGIELYKGNSSQMRVLLENGKCQSLNEVVPLVQVRSVIEYMPQLKYMIGGILGATEMAKRQRTS